jgi:hypothetical protein
MCSYLVMPLSKLLGINLGKEIGVAAASSSSFLRGKVLGEIKESNFEFKRLLTFLKR